MKKIWNEIKDYIFIILAVVLIRTNIVTPAIVDGGSMDNTLENGQLVLINKFIYRFNDINRFDIVVINNDADSDKIIKRVIGLPGDKVVIRDAKIYINDSKTPLEEPYLPEEWTEMNGSTEELEYNVPEGCYFVMGDNRNSSNDARYWINTYVKRDKIIAKAEFKYWSKGSIDIEAFDKVTYSVDKK